MKRELQNRVPQAIPRIFQEARLHRKLIRICDELAPKTLTDAWEDGEAMTISQVIQMAVGVLDGNLVDSKRV